MNTKTKKPTKVQVFDPPMCCPSGACGARVDKKLARFAASLDWLRTHGVEVDRYNPAQQYDAFAGAPLVVRAVNEHGIDCLPLILINGEIVSQGGYPDRRELMALAGIDDAEAPTA